MRKKEGVEERFHSPPNWLTLTGHSGLPSVHWLKSLPSPAANWRSLSVEKMESRRRGFKAEAALGWRIHSPLSTCKRGAQPRARARSLALAGQGRPGGERRGGGGESLYFSFFRPRWAVPKVGRGGIVRLNRKEPSCQGKAMGAEKGEAGETKNKARHCKQREEVESEGTLPPRPLGEPGRKDTGQLRAGGQCQAGPAPEGEKAASGRMANGVSLGHLVVLLGPKST